MNEAQYRAYLGLFNARDYDGVLAHFVPDCEVVFAGYGFRGHDVVREFYAFFHDHVDEQISLTRFHGGTETVALEAVVRLEGKKDLTAEMLDEKGLGRLFALARGQVIEVPQFIHYHMRDGKFAKALCAIFEPGRDIVTKLG